MEKDIRMNSENNIHVREEAEAPEIMPITDNQDSEPIAFNESI